MTTTSLEASPVYSPPEDDVQLQEKLLAFPTEIKPDINISASSGYSCSYIGKSIDDISKIGKRFETNKSIDSASFLTRQQKPLVESALFDSPWKQQVKCTRAYSEFKDKHYHSSKLIGSELPPCPVSSASSLLTGILTSRQGTELCSGSIQKAYSFISQLVSMLMSWRSGEATSLGGQIVQAGKVVVTELALPFLTLAAGVETIVYKVLAIAVWALQPIPDEPMQLVKMPLIRKREASSIFTISWTIWLLYHNVFKQQLPMNEDEARSLNRQVV